MFPVSLVLSQTSQPVTVTGPTTSHRSLNHPYTPNVYLFTSLPYRSFNCYDNSLACQANIHPPLVLYITLAVLEDVHSVIGSIIAFFVLRETMHYSIPNNALPILVASSDSRFVVGLPNQYEK